MQRSVKFVVVAALLVSGSQISAAVVQPTGMSDAAIATAISQATPGDTVQLSTGTYAFSEPVALKSGVKLLGAGQDKTLVIYKGSKPGTFLKIHGCKDVEIAHMTLDGRNDPMVHQGITGGKSRRLWLHHLTIRNLKADTWGPHAILFSGRNPTMEDGVTDSRITDCLLEDIGLDSKWGAGIRMAWGSERNQVIGNTVRRTGRGGIFGDHSAELVIRNNRVTGSGGEGLGIEIWGGCPRSLIEDNLVDHWISVDQGTQSAVRRNVVGDDATLKGYGIEIIARDVVVTDNSVNRGAAIGLSVSNKPVKNNVYWGHNTVRDCIQWGAQLQGESGGIAHHYFYRCTFEKTVHDDPRARWPSSGNGFRTNGACRGLVFEECRFQDNGGFGIQLGGRDIDRLEFMSCRIVNNRLAAVTRPAEYSALEFRDCTVQGNQKDQLPEAKAFAGPPPVADFQVPADCIAGESATFRCTSRAVGGKIVERLWDFSQGIPETAAEPKHTFDRSGKHRVTLIAWDSAGRGGRVEKTIEVRSKPARR